jgi:hypothetical protein
LIGIVLATLATPLPNRFIGHDHTTFPQELFDITEAQAEAKVQPDSVADDLDREPVILILLRGWRCIHASTLPYREGP